MKRKTARANNAFLLGSLVMIVLVLIVVVLFLFFSFRIYDKKQNPYGNDRYEIAFGTSTLGSSITIYMNDSLLFDGTPQSSLTISVGRFATESSLLVAGDEAVCTFSLPEHSTKVTIEKKNGEFELK